MVTLNELREADSNRRPSGYEPDELPIALFRDVCAACWTRTSDHAPPRRVYITHYKSAISQKISHSYFINYVIDNIFVAHKIQFYPFITELLASFRIIKQVQCPCRRYVKFFGQHHDYSSYLSPKYIFSHCNSSYNNSFDSMNVRYFLIILTFLPSQRLGLQYW